MNNPYEVLGINHDADNVVIARAVPLAMAKRKYSSREIAEAKSQLSRPETRLAVDFLSPVFSSFEGLEAIKPQKQSNELTIDMVDADKYNFSI
jgi:hypothetical protein